MEVIWTDTALETYLAVAGYLLDYWNNKELETFELKVNQLIERINDFNQVCPESKLYGYRKCVIDKQNSLIYAITNDKLILVTFLDNRSEHQF